MFNIISRWWLTRRWRRKHRHLKELGLYRCYTLCKELDLNHINFALVHPEFLRECITELQLRKDQILPYIGITSLFTSWIEICMVAAQIKHVTFMTLENRYDDNLCISNYLMSVLLPYNVLFKYNKNHSGMYWYHKDYKYLVDIIFYLNINNDNPRDSFIKLKLYVYHDFIQLCVKSLNISVHENVIFKCIDRTILSIIYGYSKYQTHNYIMRYILTEILYSERESYKGKKNLMHICEVINVRPFVDLIYTKSINIIKDLKTRMSKNM